jgi:comEA protein
MTRQEKAVLYFLIALIALGIAVKCIRAVVYGISVKVVPSSLAPDEGALRRALKEKQIVHINTATAQDLQHVPGIGPGFAKRIVVYREANGNFLMKDDIKKVKGVGGKKYDTIKEYLTLD